MWYTSVDVAGPWSFCPFSISLSSSSMLWQEKDQHIVKYSQGHHWQHNVWIPIFDSFLQDVFFEPPFYLLLQLHLQRA
jgi:hypothetical protein